MPDYITDILGAQPLLGSPGAQQYTSAAQTTSQGNTANTLESMAGAAIGNAILPGIGGVIGSKALPTIVGGIQSLVGNRQKKKASQVPTEDPFERRRLSELDNMRKSFETGSAYMNQLRQLRNVQSNTMKGALRASGGGTGALLNAMVNIGAKTNEGYADIAGEGTKRQDMYNAQYGDVLNSMAQRRAALQMQKYTQDIQDASERKNAGNQLLMNTLGSTL